MSNIKQNHVTLGLGGGSLMQIANRSLRQMMSYLIDTPDGHVIMIDGGNDCPEDAEHLYALLCERKKTVDYWFITHAHSDHLGALLYLMESEHFDLTIRSLCFHFPSLDWLAQKEGMAANERFLKAVERLNIPVITPRAGDVFSCGGMAVEVICEPRGYENYRSINPTGIMLRAKFPAQDVLFMGDFDVDAEQDYREQFDESKLRCDIVQMAHHGQQGVSRAFYEKVMPKHCLYTTPQWLWENNRYMCTNPATAGKGPFTIMETRQWMEELGAVASYPMAEGDYIFT